MSYYGIIAELKRLVGLNFLIQRTAGLNVI